MKLRSFIHKKLSVTVGEVNHQLTLAPVGDGWHEAKGVPACVCEVLRSVAKSADEYVISEEDAPVQMMDEADGEMGAEEEEQAGTSDEDARPQFPKRGRPRKI